MFKNQGVNARNKKKYRSSAELLAETRCQGDLDIDRAAVAAEKAHGRGATLISRKRGGRETAAAIMMNAIERIEKIQDARVYDERDSPNSVASYDHILETDQSLPPDNF